MDLTELINRYDRGDITRAEFIATAAAAYKFRPAQGWEDDTPDDIRYDVSSVSLLAAKIRGTLSAEDFDAINEAVIARA